MALKAEYASINEVPEEFRTLYSEVSGKAVLTGVEGIKPMSDFERVNEALRKERDDHKKTRERFSGWGDLNPDETLAKLDRIAELEQAAGGKLDDTAIDKIVETRIQSRLGPVERERKRIEAELQAEREKRGGLETRLRQTAIRDSVMKAAVTDKVVDSAIDDVLLLADRVFDVSEDGKVIVRNDVGFVPGTTPSEWLADMRAKRPHWWPTTRGGGANGSNMTEGGGANPWSADGWSLTKQGEILRTKGREAAERMAAQAGSAIGATQPARKSA